LVLVLVVLLVRRSEAMEELQFTMGGRRFRLNRKEVIEKLRGIQPGKIHTHAVCIEGVVFPVKEAFTIATGADPLDFTTGKARRILQILGFDVQRLNAAE